jgi:hypothetical protein
MVSNKSNMTKADFKRFQVKYMHMWAKKFNCHAIIHLTTKDKNKYNTPKYHYVVKFTNKYIWFKSPHMPLRFAGDINRLWPWAIRRLEGCHVLAIIMLLFTTQVFCWFVIFWRSLNLMRTTLTMKLMRWLLIKSTFSSPR